MLIQNYRISRVKHGRNTPTFILKKNNNIINLINNIMFTNKHFKKYVYYTYTR